jgi:Cu(I)/Ag(I) efflux system membrane fusion protein
MDTSAKLSSGKKFRIWWTAAAVILFGFGYLVGRSPWTGPALTPVASDQAAEEVEAHDHTLEEKSTVWTCSMHPQIRLPEPGKCPICFMDLIPIVKQKQGPVVSLRQITLSEDALKLAQVQTAPVERRNASIETRLAGQVEYDERRLGTITAWMPGRIDRLYVDYTGAFVSKGQRMADIYSPDLYAAQAELIQAVKTMPGLSQSKLDFVRESVRRTEQAARKKLKLLGLTEAQIDEVVRRGQPSDHVMIYAPLSGVVTKREVSEGVYVKTGTTIYTIADISRVWVVLEAYESDLPWVRRGQEVAFQTDAFPGRVFSGKVVFIDPFLDEKKRTVRVRLEADNHDIALKPGMYVRAVKRTEADKNAKSGEDLPLVIPATAPLLTGKRAIVYVAVPGKDGEYEGREVVLGSRAGDWYIVKEGLREGEMVVVKGAFKIDSALQILAKPSMMNPEPGGGTSAHQHGAAHGLPMAHTAQEALGVPSLFASKIQILSQKTEALDQAVNDGELTRIRRAFKHFYEEACAIDPQGLAGDAALLWRELSMLIKNDATIGSDAVDIGESRFVLAELHRHLERALGAFGVAQHDKAAAVNDIPSVFRHQLGEVFSAYISLAEALAADDGKTAGKAGETVAKALEMVKMELLPANPHELWMKSIQSMERGLESLRGAEDISQMRTGFEAVSAGLIEAISSLGVEAGGPVFELFCPMAFDGRGAYWLQKDEKVRNPYFGVSMISCGEVKRQLSSG